LIKTSNPVLAFRPVVEIAKILLTALALFSANAV